MAIFIPLAMVMLCMLTGWLQDEFPKVCPDGDEGMPAWPHNATVEYDGEPITCDELDQVVEGMGATFGIAITTGLLGTLVACLGCTWGWKLRNTDYFVTANVVNTHAAVATVTSAPQQQPQPQYYQQQQQQQQYQQQQMMMAQQQQMMAQQQPMMAQQPLLAAERPMGQ